MAERGVLEVRGVPPGAEEELVVLYFESRRRSGGGPVRSCRRLGPLLFLTFESPRDAQNVLARSSHRLGGADLGVRPAPPWDPTHLLLGGVAPGTPPEVLEPQAEALLGRPRGSFELCPAPAPGWGLLRLRDPITPPELEAAEGRAKRGGPGGPVLLPVPGTPSVVVRGGAALSPDLLELYFENRRSGGGSVRGVRVLPGGAAAVVTFQEVEAARRVLQRPHRVQDVALALAPHCPFLEALGGDAAPTASESPPTATAALPAPAPASPGVATGPGEPPAAAPTGDEDEDKDEDEDEEAAGHGQHPEAAPAWSVQDEVLVPAEPGALRFLQRHYGDLVGSIPEVTLQVLHGRDVTGVRVSGETGRCGAAAEFLRSLLGAARPHTVTLHFPGIARFLRDEDGQSLVQQLESRFQCVIDLDGVTWSPPDPQPELAELLPPSCRRDPPPAAPRSRHPDPLGDNGNGLRSNIEEIKELLATLRVDGAPTVQPGDIPGVEQDPEAESPAAAAGEGTGGPPASRRGAEEEEEEAQMLLAIQRSMDNTRHEEEELERATALSLRSYRREEEEEEEDAGLLAALEASLEEALPAADAARVTIFSSCEETAAAAQRELERALEERLRAQEVASERLRALPGSCRRCLSVLQRRHAVRLSLAGGTATLRGFAGYLAAAARDLELLLRRLPAPEPPPGACWVRWDPSGTAVPYPAGAAALLEGAWLRQERRLELLLDGRPLTVDLVRMEEREGGGARAVAVSRSCPPAESARCLLGPEAPGLEEEEEEVRLMPLAEGSEEFRDTTRHFYETLGQLRGQIGVVKVERLIHPLLYRRYQLRKGGMEAARAGAAGERVLFHGATEASSRQICLHGFNRSFCGENDTLYGLGVYFAAQAAVAVQERHSPRGPHGNKFVFVAKVLAGEYAAGGRGLRAPPLREKAGPPLRYDSVVDDPQRPGIFVIFSDSQAYPQYLITCRWHGDPP